MKLQILLLAISAVAVSSCTTAYRTGQTPDDVYFSPARPQDEYVRINDDDRYQYRYNDDYYDDRYLHMKVQYRNRWDYLDDWYLYDRYSYRYNFYYGSYYNPYTSWNYYYNPYCTKTVVVYYPKQTGTAYVPKPRNFNLASYTNTVYNNRNNTSVSSMVNKGILSSPSVSSPRYNNRNNGLSNSLRTFFSNGNSNSRSSMSTGAPSRSYNPTTSSSGSSSGSSSSSGGGSVTRPKRGG